MPFVPPPLGISSALPPGVQAPAEPSSRVEAVTHAIALSLSNINTPAATSSSVLQGAALLLPPPLEPLKPSPSPQLTDALQTLKTQREGGQGVDVATLKQFFTIHAAALQALTAPSALAEESLEDSYVILVKEELQAAVDALPPEAREELLRDPAIPGLLNLLGLLAIPAEVAALKRGIQSGDGVGVAESGLRCLQYPCTLVNSVLTGVQLIAPRVYGSPTWMRTHPAALAVLGVTGITVMSVSGIVLCVIGCVIELIGIYEAKSFKKDIFRNQSIMNNLREQLTRMQEIVQTGKVGKEQVACLRDLQETTIVIYLELLEECSQKPDGRLARCVQSQLAGEFKTEVAEMLGKFNELAGEFKTLRRSSPLNLEAVGALTTKLHAQIGQVDTLLQRCRVQVDKKILIHSLGVLSLGVAMTGLIGLLLLTLHILFPPAILLTILAVTGCVFSTGTYFLRCGIMDTEGWSFSVDDSLRDVYKAGRAMARLAKRLAPSIPEAAPLSPYAYGYI